MVKESFSSITFAISKESSSIVSLIAQALKDSFFSTLPPGKNHILLKKPSTRRQFSKFSSSSATEATGIVWWTRVQKSYFSLQLCLQGKNCGTLLSTKCILQLRCHNLLYLLQIDPALLALGNAASGHSCQNNASVAFENGRKYGKSSRSSLSKRVSNHVV